MVCGCTRPWASSGLRGWEPTVTTARYQNGSDTVTPSARVQEGDLLSRDHVVVPVMEGGKTYGTLSRQFEARHPDIPIPNLSWREAKTAWLDKGRTVTFVAYWNDDCGFTPNHMDYCAARGLRAFCTSVAADLDAALGEEPFCLSLPLFKGAEASVQALAHLEWEVRQVEGSLERVGPVLCEAEFVVRNASIVPSVS